MCQSTIIWGIIYADSPDSNPMYAVSIQIVVSDLQIKSEVCH
jgi:hypothetical protein